MEEQIKALEEKLKLRREFMDKALDIIQHPRTCECMLCNMLNEKETIIPKKDVDETSPS